MIEFINLTKRYKNKLAVDSLTATVRAGTVTGFLGPNGAGKSSTLHMLLGLSRPTSGSAMINGKPYRSLHKTISQVGSLLSVDSYNPRLTALQHLTLICTASGLSQNQVHNCLAQTGLSDAAHQKIDTFSLGMKQRLGIASALIGQPKILIMDEPFNGLDAAGIRWLRTLVRNYARAGNIVFLSSHLMAEMEHVAEQVLILANGRLIVQDSVHNLLSQSPQNYIHVITPNAKIFASLLKADGATIEQSGCHLSVRGMTAEQIGELAAAQNIVLYELSIHKPDLEQVYFDLVEQKKGADYNDELIQS